MKLISLNIEADNHFDLVLPFFRAEKPDILCLQEIFRDDISLLEDEVYTCLHYAALLNIDRPFPQYRLDGRGQWGVCILVKNELLSRVGQVEEYVYDGDPNSVPVFETVDSPRRALLSVKAHTSKKDFTIATTHFVWTKNGETDDRQRRGLQKLIPKLDSFKPFVFCGDLNAPRGNEAFDTLASHYIDTIPKNITTTLDPALHKAGALQLVVDGMFVSEDGLIKETRVVSGVSDHMALVTEIDGDL
jgi:endonuclease/exonuclease/phosphatase family metal-dependent hydrolase